MKSKGKIKKIMQKWKKITIISMLMVSILCVQVMEALADTPAPVQVSTWEDLVAAVSASSEGDVIELMDAITIPSGIALNPGGRITIKRGNAQALLTMDWNFNNDTINSFDGIIFDGSGIDSTESFLNINANTQVLKCEFRNCKALGGTVCINAGEVLFTDCTFKDNQGNTGSHIMNQSDGKVTIKDCTFTGGQSGNSGGAIYCGLDNNNVEINGCTITGNAAASNGGAIYNRGSLTIISSKVFGNTADKGADIYSATPVTTETMLTDLESIYADENIIVKGWVIEKNEIDEVFMKMDYENKPDDTDQGDSDDPGNTNDPDEGGEGSGTGEEPGTTPGEDNPPSSDPGDNGGTDAGNGGQTPGTPSDSYDTGSSDNQPGDSSGTGGNNDAGGTQQPSEQPGTGSGATGDNNSNNSTNDNSSHDSTNANSSTYNSQTTSTTNTTTDNRRTESSDNHSSTTYNYYQTEQTPVQQPQVQSEQEKDPVIINNYIKPSEQGQTASQGQQVDIPVSEPEQQTIPAPDPSNNIRIDAKGSDVVFEVKDGVYSISINASEPVQDASASVPETKSSVNWYEIIKIVLLAALVVNMLWKPRKETTKSLFNDLP